MEEELVNPNWHVALVHFPIALLLAGTLIEVLSFLYRQSGFRRAGRWMVLLGALASIPVALTGLYALADVHRMNNPNPEGTWYEIRATSPLRVSGGGMIERHAWIAGITTVSGVFLVVTWISLSDRWRNKAYPLWLLMLLATAGGTVYGAWYAGEAVYMQRVAVKPEMLTEPMTRPARKIEFIFPPEQVHVLLAGIAMAFAAVSIGLAIRRMSGFNPEPPTTSKEPTDPIVMLRSLSPDTLISRPDVPPAARFWLLASLFAILTAAAGWWLLASESSAWSMAKESRQSIVKILWDQVRPPNGSINRRFAHVIAAGAIVMLPLILALFARFAPRQKWMLTILSTLMVAVIGAQIWLGTLLLWDLPDGPLTSFNKPPTMPTTQAAQVR